MASLSKRDILRLLDDEERKVRFYLDDYFRGREISVHPNENTASLYMGADALMRLIEEHGNEAEWITL